MTVCTLAVPVYRRKDRMKSVFFYYLKNQLPAKMSKTPQHSAIHHVLYMHHMCPSITQEISTSCKSYKINACHQKLDLYINYMYFLAMSVPNSKIKQVFSNYVIIYFFFKCECYKHKEGLGEGKKGGTRKGIWPKSLNAKYHPLGGCDILRALSCKNSTNSTSIKLSAWILTAGW